MKRLKHLGILLVVLAVMSCAVLAIPGVRERVLWHLQQWSIQARYTFRPPEKQVFVPQSTVDTIIQATQTALAMANTPTIEPTLTFTLPPESPTLTPTPLPTPLPVQVTLSGVKYFDQHGLWNYCAPANLAMALSFWGWNGDRTDVGKWVKPFEKDKNVMPYELADYVQEQTNLSVVLRSGGTLDLLKRLIAGGFPVLVEKGAYMQDISGKVSWMGHYAVVTGYDDSQQRFITQDSFYQANYPVSYSDLEQGWRAFNFVFLVVYPPEREVEVMALLGPYTDATQALTIALNRATSETAQLEGASRFFAWYNRGTSLVGLQDYLGAAGAYDEAFRVYAELPEKERPWRMLWYQTGPYFAYFYSGRYADVNNLATQTIEAASEPYIEESFYWRAKARQAMGDWDGAVNDLRTSLEYHPGFQPSLAALSDMGVSP